MIVKIIVQIKVIVIMITQSGVSENVCRVENRIFYSYFFFSCFISFSSLTPHYPLLLLLLFLSFLSIISDIHANEFSVTIWISFPLALRNMNICSFYDTSLSFSPLPHSLPSSIASSLFSVTLSTATTFPHFPCQWMSLSRTHSLTPSLLPSLPLTLLFSPSPSLAHSHTHELKHILHSQVHAHYISTTLSALSNSEVSSAMNRSSGKAFWRW